MASKKTHILYIAEFSTGGSVESLHCLVRGLDKQKYRATVLFYTMPADPIVKKFEDAESEVRALYAHREEATGATDFRNRNLQGRVRKLLGPGMEKHYEAFKYALHFMRLRLPIYRALKNEIFKINPDMIHFNNGVRGDTPGMLAAKSFSAPTFCHVRTFAKLTYLNIRAADSVDKFICISRAVKETLVDYGISEDRCVVIANAVDAEIFVTSDRPPTEVRREFGFDDTQFIFALVGRVVSWKGHDYFIEAIAEAHKKNSAIVGLIVGDAEPTGKNAEFMRRLRTRVEALGLEGVVHFAGHRTDVPDIMRAADVVVCPSSEPEPFGRVIIESMSVGTPVIATDAGGAPDIIENGVNGLLVAIKNHEALAQAMLCLSKQPEKVARFSASGRADARDRYNVRRHVDDICGIYRRY